MTSLCELTVILLDIILEKSFLLWILKCETKNTPAPYWSNRSKAQPRNEDFIKSLASVDFCWFQRITKRSFKKVIWLQLKDVYWKTRRGSIVIRNNRNYFLENMQPSQELFASMEKTNEQSFFIRRQRFNRDKNAEILRYLISCKQTLLPVFMYFLRFTNQKSVARVLKEGGVVIKVEVRNNVAATGTSAINAPLLPETINNIRDRTKHRSHYTEKLMNNLNEVGVKILNSQLDRQTEVVWIWCRSQAAIETIKKLHELNQLQDVINIEFENTGTSASEKIYSKVISIDSHQLNHSIVVSITSVNVPEMIDVGRNENVRGVTILRNEIYVLCPSFSYPGIRVFQDLKLKFFLLRKIEIKEIKSPVDIESSEKNNCLYVADFDEKCVWKITKETDKKHHIVKWVIMDYNPVTLSSLSRDGQLLVLNVPSSILNMYGSGAELLRSIQLPSDIVEPRHAVETSIGTFVILHQTVKTKVDGMISSSGRKKVGSWVISKVTSDGQIVIRRFIPSNETQTLNDPNYLALDLDDRVFVADYGNDRMILLESNLRWNRIICPTKKKVGLHVHEDLIRRPKIVRFDERNNKLLVGSNLYLRKANIIGHNLKRRHSDATRVNENLACRRLKASVTGIKLRAVHDFNPKQMKDGDQIELEHILICRRLVDFPFTETFPIKAEDDLEIMPPSTIDERDEWWKVKHLKSGRTGFIPTDHLVVSSADNGKLKANSDFNPRNMFYSKIIDLENQLRSERHVENTRAAKAKIGLGEVWFLPGQTRTHLHIFERSHLWRSQYGRKISDIKEYKLDNRFIKLGIIDGRKSEEAYVGSRINGFYDQIKNDLPILGIQKYRQMEFRVTEQESLKGVVEAQRDGNLVEFDQKKENQRATSIDLDETYNADDGVDAWEEAIPLKKGDEMETIPPANIGDNVGWWMVRHLNSGQIGFIPRNGVVIVKTENDTQPSQTTLNDLPLELLDIILEASFKRRKPDSSPHQTNKDVNSFLASVDPVWCQRMKKRRFKRRTERLLKDLHDKPPIFEIIRVNRIYLLENIQPSDGFIASLVSENCITKEQSNSIYGHTRLESRRDKLLYFVKSLDETKFSTFVRCLRLNNQKLVARILENGGVVVKVTVTHGDATGVSFRQKIEELQSRTMPRSQQTEKLVSQLNDEDLEILQSELNIVTGRSVVWIWCRSQAALKSLQWRYESNLLRDILLGLAEFSPSTSKLNPFKVINIDENIFKKTAVVCPFPIKFTGKIVKENSEHVLGSAKLSNKIYILSQPSSPTPPGDSNLIRVFEDQNPFSLQQKIEIAEMGYGNDIGSSEADNCLYVPDRIKFCVWKLTREKDDQHKVTKWLIINYQPTTLSVSSGGQLLMLSWELRTLKIYGSSAKLIRSIKLPEDIIEPIHAVETSIGNVIILHRCMEKKGNDGGSRSSGINKWFISELIKDGDTIIRRFIPSNDARELSSPQYLSLDSDDQVFVADYGNNRVILLNSDLKWNRILCSSSGEAGEILTGPIRLFYHEEMKQLIVGRYPKGEGVNVYSFS